MKALLATLVFISATSAFATPAPVACGTHEKNIADAYAEMLKRGEASRLEVIEYQIRSMKAQVACGNITQADACKEESKAANDLIDATQTLVQQGMGQPYLYDKAIVDMTALIAPCSL